LFFSLALVSSYSFKSIHNQLDQINTQLAQISFKSKELQANSDSISHILTLIKKPIEIGFISKVNSVKLLNLNFDSIINNISNKEVKIKFKNFIPAINKLYKHKRLEVTYLTTANDITGSKINGLKLSLEQLSKSLDKTLTNLKSPRTKAQLIKLLKSRVFDEKLFHSLKREYKLILPTMYILDNIEQKFYLEDEVHEHTQEKEILNNLALQNRKSSLEIINDQITPIIKEMEALLFEEKFRITNEINNNFFSLQKSIIRSKELKRSREYFFNSALFIFVIMFLFFIRIIHKHITKAYTVIMSSLHSINNEDYNFEFDYKNKDEFYNFLTKLKEASHKIGSLRQKDTTELDIQNRILRRFRDASIGNFRYFDKSENEISNEYVSLVNTVLHDLELANKEIKRTSREQAQLEVSSQVAHDIRSPLAALSMLSSDLPEVNELKRTLLRTAIERITDIANNLSAKEDVTKSKEQEKYLALTLLRSVISEKRVQYRNKDNIEIKFPQSNETYDIFIKVILSDFKRLISNIINNSFEAIGASSTGMILISCKNIQNKIRIEISDNGQGIPEGNLKSILKQGASFGKNDHNTAGSGLGLSHAKEKIEQFMGDLKIESIVNIGTKVFIDLPVQVPTKWFLSIISPKRNIVIVDDDESIHEVWSKRFENTEKINIIKFSSPSKFENWVKSITNTTEYLFLIDYEFIGYEIDGIDLICKLNLEESSVLVTSRYESTQIRDKVSKRNIKMIPKEYASIINIKKTT
jgi:signal transduction histidine kinase